MIEAPEGSEYLKTLEARLEDPSVKPLRSAQEVCPQASDRSGKVRDTYDLGDALFMVITDRISTFDVRHPNVIPYKGIVLNLMSVRWMLGPLRDVVPNHLMTANPALFPEPFNGIEELAGRSMLVKKLDMIDVECIARGYIAGSAWEEYQENGTVCGMKMPPGLQESQKLPEPIFTQSTKAKTGHDINISFKELCNLVGTSLAYKLREATLKLYTAGANYALQRGIIIADTKFEFGFPQGSQYDYQYAYMTHSPMPELTLADECLTPDSSRFWPADEYEPGRPQRSMDKQDIRDWAQSTGWDKKPPAPEIPEDLVVATSRKYKDIYYKLFGDQVG